MTIHQQEQISYLMEHNEGGYYTTPANLTVKSLSHSLSCCLENLRIAIANRRELEGNGGEPEEPEVQLTERSEVWETPDA